MNDEGVLSASPRVKWSKYYFYQHDPYERCVSLFPLHSKWGSSALVVLTEEQVAFLSSMFVKEKQDGQ